MDDIDHQLLSYAKTFDKSTDLFFLVLLKDEKLNISFRREVIGKLQAYILTVARSISLLTKIAAEVRWEAISENYQSILALTRVLVELSNKFYYLGISPTSDEELRLRTLYFSLVGAVNYKKLLKTVPFGSSQDFGQENNQFEVVDRLIQARKKELKDAGFIQSSVFQTLSNKRKSIVINGETAEDYIKEDFKPCIERRLDLNEEKHYRDLGNVAVHSSAFVLFFERESEKNVHMMRAVACLSVFNVARHLALCALESVSYFPDLKAHLSNQELADIRALASGLKRRDYLKD